MADNQYGYSTGYPGFGGQPAAQSNAPYVNYPQWNAQPNYNNTSSAPYSQPPPGAPPQGYQSYNQPPPSFSQQPPQSNFNSSQYPGNDRNSGGGNRSGGGNYNSGASRGGYNKGTSDTRSGDLIVQEDTIFISGMNPRTSEQEIKTHFGAIGLIKNDKKSGKPKIWMYMDKTTGRPKGEATVTYDDAQTATSAIDWFHGKDFNGFTISVQLASRRDNWQGGRGGGGGGSGGGGGGGGGGRGGGGRGGGRGRGGPRDDYDDNRGGGGSGYNRGGDDDFGGGRNDGGGYRGDRGGGMDYGGRNDGGGYRGGGGGPGGGGFKGGNRDGGRGRGERGSGGKGFGGREGDWRCPNPDCGNTNFSWRQQCNRCNEDKPADAGSGGGDSDRRGGGGGGNRGRGGGFGGRGSGGGRGGGRGSGRGGGPMREDYGNQRSRPY